MRQYEPFSFYSTIRNTLVLEVHQSVQKSNTVKRKKLKILLWLPVTQPQCYSLETVKMTKLIISVEILSL